MLEVLGVQNADEIVNLPEDVKPADPVTENMAILKQEPVKVFRYQDHETTSLYTWQQLKIQRYYRL